MSFGCPQINDMNEHKHNYNMKINCLLALALSASSLAAQDAVIRVDAGKVENENNSLFVRSLYGRRKS